MKNKKLGKKRNNLTGPTRSNGYIAIITYSLNPVLTKNWDITSPQKNPKTLI